MTDEQIDYCIKTNELKLNTYGKFAHYGIVIFLFFIPVFIVFLQIINYLDGTLKGFSAKKDRFLILPLVLGYLVYRLQRNRLKFQSVETNLTRDELDKIIQNVSTELKWKIYTTGSKIIMAKTFPRLFLGIGGEQITILFDNQRVLVNSFNTNDLSSVILMGRNQKKNTKRLIEDIEKASSQ